MVDPERAKAWAAQGQEPLGQFFCSSVLFWLHQVLPNVFKTNFTLLEAPFLTIKFIAIATLAASPLWIDYLAKSAISLGAAIGYSVILILSMIYLHFYSIFSRKRSDIKDRKRHENLVALRHVDVVKSLQDVVSLRSPQTLRGQRDELIKDLLRSIDHKTRAFLGQYQESYFQTSLLVFRDSQGTQLLIKSRAYPNRREGVVVKAQDSAAYFVAQAKRDWKAIHDLKRDRVFDHRGLSDPARPPYRSILLIPIITSSEGGDGTICKGVVSIDAAKPYEFWSSRGSDLTTQVMPYTEMIGLLLDGKDCGMTV